MMRTTIRVLIPVQRQDNLRENLQYSIILTALQKVSSKGPPKKMQKKLAKHSQTKQVPEVEKAQSFRFFDLPPELRDMIYKMALEDANGVSLIARTDGSRRTARRGSVYPEEDFSRQYFKSRRLKWDTAKELAPASTRFLPVLLAVSRQINAEAINILYGQNFIFGDPAALHHFLAIIGPRNQQRLTSIQLAYYGSGTASSNAMCFSALTLLSGATKLKKLFINCEVPGSFPGNKAKRIFRDAHYFLEMYGVVNGKKDAAVDIITLGASNFKYLREKSLEEQRASFEGELRKKLGVARPH